MKRLRNKYTKDERVKFISHLDLLRVFQRALRRADIKVAFSQGFNPHPKISFGPALVVGATTEGDYMDIDVEEDISPEEFRKKMNKVLPPGIEIVESYEVELNDALSTKIKGAEYILQVNVKKSIKDIQNKIEEFMKRDIIEIEKKSKSGRKMVNIRPYVLELKVIEEAEDYFKFYIKLKLGEGAPNPLHLLKALNDYIGDLFDMDFYKLHRKNMILE
ncbi:TIGR03936 family radical SAM-associated protein [Thermoanaerobacter siderophilus]|uniref:Radical SAM-linked protein n=1 Tax=Thermoanaerobacter siderophilus SR4 TaxID=880478 RepID=I9KUS4_9THEO|nr:TIGR03936 family radical SAM-associated protein [Thermoanaerobacter siderophilus]EIW00734.1 radical SAM-linked protein [Thermoanaerobacter siderophilus SR4]